MHVRQVALNKLTQLIEDRGGEILTKKDKDLSGTTPRLNAGQKFFSRTVIKAFGAPALNSMVRTIKKANNGKIPKGIFVDKTV
jgi:hypothetical protein